MSKFRANIIVFFSTLILISLLKQISFSQTINTKFGKNRVQYHAVFNDWWMYENDHYIIYWYGKERNLAKTAILLTQLAYDDIEEILDFKINKKIKLIIYSNISDFKQSNLGIKNEEIKFTGPGMTKFYENKVIVYFDGDHNNMLKQIRLGTAKVFLKNMFSELSFENIYKKLVYSDFPEWFTKGLIEYLADKWNIHDNEILRNIFTTYDLKKIKFEEFALNAPELAGKSFYYFIDQKYGKSKLSDLLYLIRISRDPETSFLSITNKNLNDLFIEWKSFYRNYYSSYNEINNQNEKPEPLLSIDSKYPVTSISISNNGNYLSYATNNNNKIKLYLVNIISGKKSEILNLGYINEFQETDYNYPICVFNENDNGIYIIYEKKGDLYLRNFSIDNREYDEQVIAPEYNRIYSFDIWDSKNLILNANSDGYPDFYMYNIKSRQSRRLTNDFWDNLDANVETLNGKKVILFASNRLNSSNNIQYLDTIPPLGNFDIFFLDIKNNKIIRLTDTPGFNERHPSLVENNLVYITDETGALNIKRQKVNDTLSAFITNVQGRIDDIKTNREFFLYSYTKLCDYKLLLFDKDISQIRYSPINAKTLVKNDIKNAKNLEDEDIEEDIEIEIDSGIMFQSRFKAVNDFFAKAFNTRKVSKENHLTQSKPVFERFNSSRAVATRLRFSFTDLITKVDNEPLFEGMEAYTGEQDPNFGQPTGFMLKSRVKDMFEDYFLEAGIRFSSDFRTKEYFSIFENLKHRLDWQYAYYRKTQSRYTFKRTNFIDKTRMLINMGHIRAKYPFDTYSSLSLTGQLRLDKNILLASDTFSLNLPNITEQRISLQFEYIFDNTSKTGVNSYIGNRSKFFLRTYNKFNIRVNTPATFNLSKKLMLVLGFDTRQYFQIFGKSILAFRMSGQTSFGTESNLYFLGGMENWMFAHNDNLIPVPQNDNYAYKVLVANMRGFGYNARNGTSYLLSNNELRIPVFQYLSKDRIKRAFFRDFQLTMFFDIGTAWRGLTPFSESNPANTRTIEVPPSIKIKLKYYADPIVAGYGLGARTTFLGYFLKFDYAWGIETGNIQKPVFYFTMGYDF